MIKEAADQHPAFEALTGDVTTLCHHCPAEEEKVLVANHETLAATYENIQTLTQARIELCKEWTQFVVVHKACVTQMRAMLQQLDSRDLTQADIETISKEMLEAREVLQEWDARRKQLDQLMMDAQMVLKERATRRILHFHSEIQSGLSVCDKAALQLTQRQGKLDELSHKWAEFDDRKQSLLGTVGHIGQQVEGCRARESSLGGLREMTKDIKHMEKELEGRSGDLDKLRDLGRQLMAADPSHMTRAQDGLNETDIEWETVQSLINNRLQVGIAFSNLWQQYLDSKTAVRQALVNAEPLLYEDQTLSSQAELKKKLDRYKVRAQLLLYFL